jgi:hypothetical protein
MAGLPICIITGRIAGDRLGCGDCDACIGGASSVPDAVKVLLKERDEWMEKYADAMGTIDEMNEAADDYAIERDLAD